MASILRPGNIKDFTIHGKNGSRDLSGNKSKNDSKLNKIRIKDSTGKIWFVDKNILTNIWYLYIIKGAVHERTNENNWSYFSCIRIKF